MRNDDGEGSTRRRLLRFSPSACAVGMGPRAVRSMGGLAVHMNVLLSSMVLVAGTLVSCTSGGGSCDGAELTVVEENASGPAESCPPKVIIDGVTYERWCLQIRDEFVGEKLAGDGHFVARSILGVTTTSAVAVGWLDDHGQIELGKRRCGGWTYAPSFEITPRYRQDIFERVRQPKHGPNA